MTGRARGGRNRPAAGMGRRQEGRGNMGRIIKAVLVLAIFGFAGLTGYAYLGEDSFRPAPAQVTKPVVLNGN